MTRTHSFQNGNSEVRPQIWINFINHCYKKCSKKLDRFTKAEENGLAFFSSCDENCYRVDWHAAGEDMKGHEEDVRGEVAAELDDRRLVVLVVQRQGEDDPDRGDEGEQRHEGENLCPTPVRNATFPKFLVK